MTVVCVCVCVTVVCVRVCVTVVCVRVCSVCMCVRDCSVCGCGCVWEGGIDGMVASLALTIQPSR